MSNKKNKLEEKPWKQTIDDFISEEDGKTVLRLNCETFQSAIQKIPLALENLKVNNPKLVQNYIHNLVLAVLKDPELQKRLVSEPEKLIDELSKI